MLTDVPRLDHESGGSASRRRGSGIPRGRHVYQKVGGLFLERRGNVANLIFGAQSYETTENSFVFKLDRNNRNETKIFYFSGAQKYPLIAGSNGKEFPMGRDSYHMKVVVGGSIPMMWQRSRTFRWKI